MGIAPARVCDFQNWPRRWEKVTDTNKHDDHEINTYEYSGIQERHGKVNAWLIIVYISLLIWGAWYLFTFWNHA
jgi:hypothetical protein